jgi:hypothetical protein
LDTRLIKANIALFKGERAETLRFLQEYVAEFGFSLESDPDAPLVMWLDAQAQTERDERLRRLRMLVNSVPAGNHYRQMAQNTLSEEERLGRHENAPQTLIFGLSPRMTGLVVVIGFLLIAGAAVLLSGQTAGQPAVSSNETAAPSPTALNLPDLSQALVADSFSAHYPRGVLQVIALEEDSKRVIDTREQTLATPVPGARFYALSLTFECRGGICNEPPEAQLALQLDNGDLIPLRQNASIAGQPTLQPIALGRTTAGWVVFEVPLVSTVKALVVSPPDPASEQAFDPVTIALPSF